MGRDIVYLAGPYTDEIPEVRRDRFEKVTQAAAYLIELGHVVYSPLTMTHPIDLVLAEDGQTLGSDYWVAFDEAFMAFCSSIIILKISGWDKSSGVKRETEYFSEVKGVKPQYLEWEDVVCRKGLKS